MIGRRFALGLGSCWIRLECSVRKLIPPREGGQMRTRVGKKDVHAGIVFGIGVERKQVCNFASNVVILITELSVEPELKI
jgi:hypothetical protein